MPDNYNTPGGAADEQHQQQYGDEYYDPTPDPGPSNLSQTQQQQQQHGPGPFASRSQMRQWPNPGPWQRHDHDDADTSSHPFDHHQHRPFRLQHPPPGHNRPSRPPRPVLDLRSETQISPDLISPRSDSFFYSSRPARPCLSPTPTISHFQPVYRPRAESAATQRTPRSAFPGLSSNPFIPETPETESRSETRKFPLLARQHEQLARLSPVSNLESPVESRQSTPTEPNMAVENFSRPRKPSVRSQQSDSALSRRVVAQRPLAEPPLTFSSIPPRPSNDYLIAAPRTDSLRHANAAAIGPPPPFPRPPPAHAPYYNCTGPQGHLREVPPWVAGGDELRSSFRSQLTSSTAHGTLSTAAGTERNSVLTKASSITEQSIINGYFRRSWQANSIDDGPSLEDVMGMYERGFRDSDIDIDSIRRSMRFPEDDQIPGPSADMDTREMDGSRPASCHSDASGLREKVLEAMGENLSTPGAMPIPGSGTSTARNSRTRRSLLPSSLPKEIEMGLASEQMGRREKSEPDSMEKHDSAKMLDEGDGIVLPEDESEPASPSSTVQTQLPMSPTSLASPTSPTSITSDLPSPRTITPGTFAPAPIARLPQEPPEELGSRDRYGFRKASNNVSRQEYDAWDANYSEYLARRRRKWIAFLKDNSLMTDHPNRFPPRGAKTKRFIRKGIPPDWRGAAWFYYAGGPAILSKHRGVYEQLVKRAGLNPTGPGMLPDQEGEVKPLIVDDIEKDLYRTFPDNVRFKPPPPAAREAPPPRPPSQPAPEPEIITSLRRVLNAFALYNPRIGYCQSLNFLAGLLLLFVETEEQAFWLLNIITRVYLPGTHEMSLEGSKVDLGVLMVALKDSMPAVWKLIGGDEFEAGKRSLLGRHRGHTKGTAQHGSVSDPNRLPAITLCMTAWFMSCFIGTLPIESVLRVWDVFFYEGSRTLFRIALTIFKLGEREIRAVQDPMEMFGVVQTFPRRMIDANALMEACYRRRNGIGHLSQDAVEEKRQERREGIRKWRAEQEAAASDSNGGGVCVRRRGIDWGGGQGLDLAADFEDVRRKANLFGRKKEREKDKEQTRAAEVV
ncbi:hypothetical protein N0V88_006873 [Collariella sp. IMI 366227]|nr:hypothetical protein N0V88_006873 [Collariella sp. IMI 366227]